MQLFEVMLPNYSKELSTLRAAIWYNYSITSFPTKEPWNENLINVNVTKLDENGEVKTVEKIINYFAPDKINIAELEKLQQESIHSGEELLKQKDELFPNLEFCGDSQYQLKNFSLGKSILEKIKEILFKLNNSSEKWQKNNASYSNKDLQNLGLKISGESQTVNNNPSMRSEREFYLPNGRKEFFENHIKVTDGIRIHFYPNTEDKKIYIGYIGKHLETKKF